MSNLCDPQPREASAQPGPADPGNAWLQPLEGLMKEMGQSLGVQSTPTKTSQNGESSELLTPKIKSLEERLNQIERMESARSDENGENGLEKQLFPGTQSASRKSRAGPSDFDLLFDDGDESPENGEGGGEQKPDETEAGTAPGMGAKCGDTCAKVWGGPTAPYEDDSIGSWLSNFFGGVTTAHGINRAFDEGNGLVRRVFWICLFFLSFIVLVFQLQSSFEDYFSAATTTNINSEDGDSMLPMITVCNLSPIRCGCEGFYDPEIRDNDETLRRVLPFLCGSVLGYDESFTGDVDGSGKRVNIQILETARDRVDLTKTRNKMMAYTSTLSCDNGPYTKRWFIDTVKSGVLTQHDLMKYAGYHDRGRIVRFCAVKDDLTGEKVSCMDDRFWSEPVFDDIFGACHTINPCHGFPVGQECEADEDCAHDLGARIPGGRCNGGMCECTKCKAGSDCKVLQQLKPGKGEGIRMVLNVAVDQDAQIMSAEKARWSPGALVHMHSFLNDKSLEGGVSAAPGRVTDILIGQSTLRKAKKFPWTNCSTTSISSATLCQTSCLKRTQAIECCGKTIEHNQDGRFPPLSITDPSGAIIQLDNPVLDCNILDDALEACLNKQSQRVAEGTICIDGAATLESTAYFGLLQRTGWYNPQTDSDDNGIPDQEEEDSNSIENHCVWKGPALYKPDGLTESRLGKECEEAKDCKSDTGDEDRLGECRKAYRAYCPGRCNALEYEIVGQSSSLLSETAAQIMANDELAWVSYQAAQDPTASRRWQPRCGRTPNGTYIDTDTCFTTAEAMNLVRSNYAMINVDYDDFTQQVVTIEDKIPTDVLLGTVGGNLGMWVGMSIMTITEMFELLFFAILAAPFFWFGIKLPYIKRREPEGGSGDVDLSDEDLQRVLRNLQMIAKKRKQAPEMNAQVGYSETTKED
mmetsp:Transcript_55218/g.112957  ORF Transcript_55218/g.112957 Transcript_55218/m.112957 type:complete len:921 (+) Transcript_55218:100-2862(+)|eukprot:CAMPEP_0181300054 /NCGR_PEP_ID=MMETSP1101-20121128/6679_1 /TAXON_ID=46948 /ORGANISM="Rhodomonas abbreviata, Strain Caron Lab Isolate" /LENGTH=920 /DNA_ID=CAMNT_0023405253 /DNA_START=98 /DNA_END=2860 /DNA_ORIENTATION=-